MSSVIEEYQGTGPSLELADLLGRERPLVIRGLCRDWPMVAWSRQSERRSPRGWRGSTTAVRSTRC
ncbi:hypothetical protein [Rhodanobacter lindaniclasticus]